MNSLDAALGKLTQTSNTLQAAIDEVSSLIRTTELLRTAVNANASIEIEPYVKDWKASIDQHSEKLYHNVPKKTHSLKGMHTALNNYDKAIKQVHENYDHPPEVHESLEGKRSQVERLICHHFTRDGEHELVDAFTSECRRIIPPVRDQDPVTKLSSPEIETESCLDPSPPPAAELTREQTEQDIRLRCHFDRLKVIVTGVRDHHDLGPAIRWAQSIRDKLDNSASRIEFELCMLEYISILLRGGPDATAEAWLFASENLTHPHLWRQDGKKIQQLVCALAFGSREQLTSSPYGRMFDLSDSWDNIVDLIMKEYCVHMAIPARSPLLVSVNAGVAGLPVLAKIQQIIHKGGAGWSTVKELPVMIPLPPSYIFHPIFICPVSKEQATPGNPPMMLPCGHVIAKSSAEMLVRSEATFKCPYCPAVASVVGLKEVFLR